MKVKNRSASIVVYHVPDFNVRRRFVPGEIKEIPVEELKQLVQQSGGREILTNCLQVSKEDIKQLDLVEQEREYFYSDEQIKTIMTVGSLDEFLDMLDFAPEGVIDLVKKYAISLPMRDLYKMNALKEKTGFDATKAMENSVDEEAELTATPVSKRRVVEDTAPAAPARRTIEYKIITDN